MVRRAERGFTLVELLVALAISMVGLLGLLSLQMVALKGNTTSRDISEAVSLAQEKMEALQIVPYANLTAQAGTESNKAPSPGNTTQNIYTRVTTVTVLASSTKLQVDVSWKDASALATATTARAHKVTMFSVRVP